MENEPFHENFICIDISTCWFSGVCINLYFMLLLLLLVLSNFCRVFVKWLSNNKVLVRGIFCDLEKAFDCVNHDNLLSKLKFYGISDRDLQLYQSYMGNRYCRTAIYNDSENSNIVSYWARVRHGVPQGSILRPLLFLLCINDLPKIINRTSAPIIFADDTSILFAQSNLIDLNKTFA